MIITELEQASIMELASEISSRCAGTFLVTRAVEKDAGSEARTLQFYGAGEPILVGMELTELLVTSHHIFQALSYGRMPDGGRFL